MTPRLLAGVRCMILPASDCTGSNAMRFDLKPIEFKLAPRTAMNPFCLLFVLLACTHLAAAAEPAGQGNWPTWRGPHDAGCGGGGAYPAGWAEGRNILWTTALPGAGCSTPAVWNDQILLTSPHDGQEVVLAYDWQGQLRWETVIGPERKGKHRNGSGTNPSPATDGERLFVYFKTGDLAGLNLAGKLLWKTNLQERFAKDSLYWDLGTSPVLTQKSVVVAVMHNGDSYLAAFDKATGDLQWKVARNYETPTEGDHSYATPLVIDQQGRQVVVVWGAERLTAHAADDGRMLWSCGGFNPEQNRNWVAVASAVVSGDMAIVPYGRGTSLAGVRLGGDGDITATNRIWTRHDTGAFVPSPAVANDKLFVLRDGGELECIDSKTGTTLFSGRLPKHRDKYYASPVVAGGKLFAAREDGMVFVADINNRFELLSENDMHERVIASPVAVRGRLLIRGEEHLYCIGTREPATR